MVAENLDNYKKEYTDSKSALSDIGECIVVLGSSSIKDNTQTYVQAELTGSRLAQEGYSVATGGGPGLMEAVNKGAQQAGGKSIGVCMKFPDVFIQNQYIDDNYNLILTNMAARKHLFWDIATAFIVLPGGFGTLDEATECMTLIQMNEIERRPIIFQDKNFWLPAVIWLKQVLKNDYKVIRNEDMAFIHITNNIDESINIIKKKKN